MIKIKRVYEKQANQDGYRVLVDRLWPRGVNKARSGIDEWAQELAPSAALRKTFGHDPLKWAAFKAAFRAELESPIADATLRRLSGIAQRRTVTLLYAARDEEHNNARVLRDILTA